MRFVIKLMRRIIISSILLYLVNMIMIQYKFVIPINFYSVSIVSLLGVFGFIGLIVFRMFL